MLRSRFTPRHPITHVGFTADGELITTQPHTCVVVRARTSGEVRAKLDAPNAVSFSHVVAHPTHPLVAAQCPKWCRVFDTHTGSFDGRDQSASYFGIAPIADGFRLFDAHPPDGIECHDVGVSHPQGWCGRVRVRTAGELVAVTPDGRLAVAVRPRSRPVLIDVTTGRVVAELNAAVRSRNRTTGHLVVVFSPDGSKLALGNGDSLAVFDLSRVKSDATPPEDDEPKAKRKVLYPLFTLDRPDPVAGRGTHADRTAERWLPPVAFDPDGRTLLTVGLRNRVQRIDVATGGVIVEWGWRADAVRSLAVAPDGLTAAADCRLGELIVWDLE